MTSRDEKLSTNLGEAAELAIAEHLATLKMDNPEQIDVENPETHVVEKEDNPTWLKVKTLKTKAASDILRVMTAVDPQSMKGRKTDRTWEMLRKVTDWKGGRRQGTA